MIGILAGWVVNPLFYIGFFLLMAWCLRKSSYGKRVMLGIALLLLCLFTNAPLYQALYRQWFAEYDRPLATDKVYRYGIVLGGYSNWDWERNRVEFGQVADRLLEGIRLYHQGQIKKLVLASDGSIIESENDVEMKGNPEGMLQYLEALGMPRKDVILETKAWNTQENATFTLELVGDVLKTEPSLLITSAVHMRRSLMTFRREGILAEPYITDTPVQIGDEKPSWVPSLAVLLKWSELLHEWIGYVVYQWRG